MWTEVFLPQICSILSCDFIIISNWNENSLGTGLAVITVVIIFPMKMNSGVEMSASFQSTQIPQKPYGSHMLAAPLLPLLYVLDKDNLQISQEFPIVSMSLFHSYSVHLLPCNFFWVHFKDELVSHVSLLQC
jgi:hypothetical protein